MRSLLGNSSIFSFEKMYSGAQNLSEIGDADLSEAYLTIPSCVD